MSKAKEDFEVLPFTIIVDTSEQHPYRFDCIPGDAKNKGEFLFVPLEYKSLETGDYSIKGMEHLVSVERKSLSDAYGTFGGGRKRFVRELERFRAMEFGAVVIEADWKAILKYQNEHGPSESGREFTPKHFYRTVIAWQQRFPYVHWWPCWTRNFAERTTFRILQRFWQDTQEGKRAKR